MIEELHIFDAKDLTNPIWKSSFEINGAVNSLAINENKLFVATPSNPELLMFDISMINLF